MAQAATGVGATPATNTPQADPKPTEAFRRAIDIVLMQMGSTVGLAGQVGSALLTEQAHQDAVNAAPQLQAEAYRAVSNDPAAKAALENLIKSGDFQSLSPEARNVVLSQVKNYPDARSIGNLERLTGRQWFRDAWLSDQQRSAKLVAYASQYSEGDTAIINNALHFLLTGDVKLRWGQLGDVDTETHSGGEMKGTTIILDEIPDGDGPLDDDHNPIEIFAHEVNHVLNHTKASESFKTFMGEYRAWYVGFEAANGRAPSQKECFDRATFILIHYEWIGNAFLHSADEADKMVKFMARIAGQDPEQATPISVLIGIKPDRLSTRGVGLPPEPVDADDPNNVDNHN